MSQSRNTKRIAALATTLATCAYYGGGLYASIAITNSATGYTLEDTETEYQQRAAAAFEDNLQDILEMRDEVADIEYQSYEAYQNDDTELYDSLMQDMQDRAEVYDAAYDKMIMGALTNKFLSEAGYKDIVEKIEDNNLPTEVTLPSNVSFSIDSDNAEFLNACRIESKNGVFPLKPEARDARKVASCMEQKDMLHLEAVSIVSVVSVFALAMINLTSIVAFEALPQQRFYDRCKNALDRRRRKRKTLPNN